MPASAKGWEPGSYAVLTLICGKDIDDRGIEILKIIEVN
jgi:hypothetical protein